jgi:hypothetical protein
MARIAARQASDEVDIRNRPSPGHGPAALLRG